MLQKPAHAMPIPASAPAPVAYSPIDELSPYRSRLESLKAQLKEKQADPKGCGCGCLTVGAAIVFAIWSGFDRLSWAVIVGAAIVGFVVFGIMSPTSPEEKALRAEIDELEKFIARSEAQR